MADQKISQLTPGGPAQAGDELPVARSGTNVKLTANEIASLPIAQQTLTGGTVTVSTPVIDATQTWNAPAITTTGASGNGTTATITFAAQPTAFPIGSTIVVENITPTGYRGTFVVTGSTTTSVSYANATTGAQTVAGTVQQRMGGLKFNVTDTASNANSLLMDLQVGGTSQFAVSKVGKLTGKTNANLFSVNAVDINGSLHGVNIVGIGGNFLLNGSNTAVGLAIGNGMPLSWSSNANVTNYGDLNIVDLKLFRDAANTLAQRNSTNAQTFRVYNTFTDASNYERGKIEWASNVLRIGTEKAGTGSARALELQTDGTTRLTIATGGTATFAGALESASVKTDAPAGGTSGTWKLGVAATVSPTSPNRTIEVDIGGTIYYLHAKTTND